MNKYLTKEMFAALGVILSLLFVAYELNQSTRVARAEARNELAAANAEWNFTLANNSEIRDLWYSVFDLGLDGFNNLPQSQAQQFRALLTLNMRRFENVYFHYREGLVDESALSSYGLQVSSRYRSEVFVQIWPRLKQSYDPGFVSFFEENIGF